MEPTAYVCVVELRRESLSSMSMSARKKLPTPSSSVSSLEVPTHAMVVIVIVSRPADE